MVECATRKRRRRVRAQRDASMTKAAARAAASAAAGSAAAAALQLRRRRHKTVHFGENLLMQVCTNRAHLAALGARTPDISFCHAGRTPDAAGYCCVAHHCCLAVGEAGAVAPAPTAAPQRHRRAHQQRPARPGSPRSDSQSHSSGADTLDKPDKGKRLVKMSSHSKRIVPHHSHHHHHHVHQCPLHVKVNKQPKPIPVVKNKEKALVPKARTAPVSPYLMIPSKLEPNVQQLFSFIEGVLSAWAAEEGLTSTGEYSEPDERDVNRKKIKKYKLRTNILNIRRIVYDVSILRGTKLLGNVRYRHYHWKGTAQECNEMFLLKISDDDRMSLTTAVSDDDDVGAGGVGGGAGGGESAMSSPYRGKQTGAAAASFNCTGAVRKAGLQLPTPLRIDKASSSKDRSKDPPSANVTPVLEVAHDSRHVFVHKRENNLGGGELFLIGFYGLLDLLMLIFLTLHLVLLLLLNGAHY